MVAAARGPGIGSGDRRGRRARQLHRDPRFSRHLAAGAGAAWRNPSGAAHARRRADAADRRSRTSRSRSAGSKSITWRAPRATFTLRCCPIGAMQRASTRTATRTAGRREGRHREAEPTLRTCAGRRPVPAVASAARLERMAKAAGWGGSASAESCAELNRLLRGAKDTTFLAPPALRRRHVRYVITLDADTRLPRETVGRLIGKMAHPLNRPRLDADLGRVVEGYGILQPRVTPALPVGREGSLFLRVFSSATGIDPYAAAVSDVYQDLFGEGTYTGKGIYDVDAFEAAMARTACPSPRSSATICSRESSPAPAWPRTSRSWRISPPAMTSPPFATTAGREATGSCFRGSSDAGPRRADRRPRGGVPAIGRWKMLDNLRRSLSAPSLVVALIAGWAMSLRRRGRLDRFHPVDDRPAAAHSRDSGYRAAPPRRDVAQPLPRLGHGTAPCAHPVRPDDCLPGASGLADG